MIRRRTPSTTLAADVWGDFYLSVPFHITHSTQSGPSPAINGFPSVKQPERDGAWVLDSVRALVEGAELDDLAGHFA